MAIEDAKSTALAVDEVRKLLEQTRVESRSWLYRWLYANYAELAPVLNGRRPPWAALARTIAANSGWDGKPSGPSRQAVLDAWRRVRADRTKAGKPDRTPPSTQTNREQVSNVEHNRDRGATGFKFTPAAKVDPDEWGPKK
jgi:hypothetical protein